MAFLNRLLIKRDSALKGVFDIVMLIVSVYNIYGNAYYSAFEVDSLKEELWFILFDNIIELLFFIDMC